MRNNLRSGLFVITFFLLGSINVLYNTFFYVFVILAFLVNVVMDWRGFQVNMRKEWRYWCLPLLFSVYVLLHYGCSLLFANVPYKASGGILENVFLYFFFVPLYLLSARDVVTARVLRRALSAFCWGVLLFNFAKLFCCTGWALFSDTERVLHVLYAGRFGGNMEMLSGFVYLEPQAVYICASALTAYFFMLNYDKGKERLGWLAGNVFVFVCSLAFLSFTVTKGAVLAFAAAFVFLSVVYCIKRSWRFRLVFAGVVVVCILGISFTLPGAYMSRLKSMKQEIVRLSDGNFRGGGSVTPRWGLMKENFSHLDEFGIWGLGLYKSDMIHDWYEHSPYHLKGIHNAHNTFVEYWLSGGLLGLLFILYYFLAPLIKMWKECKWNYLPVAIVISMFVAANTCAIANLEDSLPVVVFMLSLFYLYSALFKEVQDKRYELKSGNIS